MRVDNYSTRNFATLGPSELRPPFTGPEVQSFHIIYGHLSPEVSSTGQASDPIRHLSILQSPVFLVNSRHPRVVPPLFYKGPPFPEVTEEICRVPST